jgi:hypothetical protein
MRLPESKIKEAILHPDSGIREQAVRYFAQGFSQDTSLAPLVIQAVERYGRENAYPLIGASTDLAHTDETIAWAVDELNREDALSQFTCRAIEPVRQMVLTQRLDGELRHLRDHLVEACEIMGERFPEIDQWKETGKRERAEHFRQIEEVVGDPERALLFVLQKTREFFGIEEKNEEKPSTPPPPPRQPGGMASMVGRGPGRAIRPANPARNVGRNDPCPCGNGKKFKKCCVKKQGPSLDT